MHASQYPQDGFVIAVTVSQPQPPRLSFLEYCAYKIGPPPRVLKICDRVQLGLCAWTGAYILTWTFLIGAAVRDRLDLSEGATLLLAMAWTPVMAIGVILGALRYGAINLMMKQAQQLSEHANLQFFEHVRTCVSDGVERAIAMQAPTEKPTLQ